MSTKVIKLHYARTFIELLENVDPILCGWGKGEAVDPGVMEQYYSIRDIEKFGVVGIELSPE